MRLCHHTCSITRGDLEGHKAKVIVIPAIVFVAGIVSHILTTHTSCSSFAAAVRFTHHTHKLLFCP